MKTVIWDSEERIIPGHGVATPGTAISLPDELAHQFIAQKQAHAEAPKSRRTNQEE